MVQSSAAVKGIVSGGFEFFLSAPVVKEFSEPDNPVINASPRAFDPGSVTVPAATVTGGSGESVITYEVFIPDGGKVGVEQDGTFTAGKGVYTVIYTAIDEAYNITVKEIQLPVGAAVIIKMSGSMVIADYFAVSTTMPTTAVMTRYNPDYPNLVHGEDTNALRFNATGNNRWVAFDLILPSGVVLTVADSVKFYVYSSNWVKDKALWLGNSPHITSADMTDDGWTEVVIPGNHAEWRQEGGRYKIEIRIDNGNGGGWYDSSYQFFISSVYLVNEA
jgi:hypothetical protein